MSGMWHDHRNGSVDQRSLAIGHSNPCVCTADPAWVDVVAGCNRFTGLTVEEIVVGRKTAGTKIGNNSNPAAEHGELLAAANF